MAVAGAAFIALLTGATVPVQAALLDFSFTTESGATGSFTLETDTPSSSQPGIFAPGVSGISYPKESCKNNLNTFDWEVKLKAYSRLNLYNLFLHDA